MAVVEHVFQSAGVFAAQVGQHIQNRPELRSYYYLLQGAGDISPPICIHTELSSNGLRVGGCGRPCSVAHF